MCPITIAAIAEGRIKNKIPQIRLPIARPLVSGVMGAPEGLAGPTLAGEETPAVATREPQLGQKRESLCWISWPQEVQKVMPLPREEVAFASTILPLSNKLILPSRRNGQRRCPIRTAEHRPSLSNRREPPTMWVWQIPTSSL